MAHNDKRFCLSHSISQELYIIYCNFWYICIKFFLFTKSWFLEFLGGKRAKHNLKLPISVCFALCFRNCISSQQDFDNDIYRLCFPLFFLKKCNIINIKIILLFIDPLQRFLIIICFSSSLVSAKKKFWGVPHLHMCVSFSFLFHTFQI